MKTTKKDFELFKKYSKKWLKKFGLDYYDILWLHEKCSARARAVINSTDSIATVTLADKWELDPINAKALDLVAKHEMLHILLAELKRCINDRYIIEDQAIKAEHDVIAKLEILIA